MYRTGKLPKTRVPKLITFGPWIHGLQLSSGAGLIGRTELTEATNWFVRRDGILQARPALTEITTSAVPGTPGDLYWTTLGGGTWLVATDSGLYRLDDGDPVLLAEDITAPCQLLDYGDVCLVLDGDYLRYISVSGSTWSVHTAYDSGSGDDGYLIYELGLDADSAAELGQNVYTRAAQKITSPAWMAGYTIPPVRVEASLQRTGDISGNVYARVRAAADDSVLAEEVLCDADDPPSTGWANFSVEFATVAAEMAPETDYYVSVEFEWGVTGEYLSVAATAVSGDGGCYRYAGGEWSRYSGYNLQVALSPGLPPKARFGAVWQNRPWIGGGDDDSGLVRFGNLSHLDWSTENGGGYIGLIDQTRSGFAAGGMGVIYGVLFIVGSQDTPYMVRISGDGPENYVQETMYSTGYTDSRCVQTQHNALWYGAASHIWALRGVQEYGDVQSLLVSDAIEPLLLNQPMVELASYQLLGLMIGRINGDRRLLVANSQAPTLAADQVSIRYPWSVWECYINDYGDSDLWEWIESVSHPGTYHLAGTGGANPGVAQPNNVLLDGTLVSYVTAINDLGDHTAYWGDADSLGYPTLYLTEPTAYENIHDAITPLAIAADPERVAIASSEGRVFTFDETLHRDLGSVYISPTFRTGLEQIPAASGLVTSLWPVIYCRAGSGVITMDVYRNSSSIQYAQRITYTLPMDDSVLVNDMDATTVAEALVAISSTNVTNRYRVNVRANAAGVRVRCPQPMAVGLHARSLSIMYRPLSY